MDVERRWIEVVGWSRFQHYRDRNPTWIKTYPALLADDDYMALTARRALILHRLWLDYALTDGRLRADDTATLSRRLGMRVTVLDLKSLNDAGFIQFSASKPLATRYHDASESVSIRYHRDRERERRPPNPADTAGNGSVEIEKLNPRDLGTNPRALGTNPRANVEREQRQRHADLVAAAGVLVDQLPQTGSDVVHDRLDVLEREYGSRLNDQERARAVDRYLTRWS